MWTEGGQLSRRFVDVVTFDPGTASIVGGGLGAVGSIGGGLLGSGAAKAAAQTQADAAARSAQLQSQQFNQTRATQAPFIQGGTDALQALRVALGLTPANVPTTATAPTFSITDPQGNVVVQDAGPDALAMAHQFPAVAHIVQTSAGTPATTGQANPLAVPGLGGLVFNPTQATLEATPGYQFNLAQGLRGVENSAAAQGRGLSGAALKAAARFASGLASTTLGQQQQIFQQNLGNVLNPLMSLVGTGANTSVQQGNQAVQSGANVGGAVTGGGNALAAGQVGSANALSGALTGAAGAGSNAATNFLLFNALQGGGANAGVNTTFNGFAPALTPGQQGVGGFVAPLG